MSTVGYSDLYPVTDSKQLIGGLIIVVGVGIFGTLTGFLANAFLAPREVVAAVAPPRNEANKSLDKEDLSGPDPG